MDGYSKRMFIPRVLLLPGLVLEVVLEGVSGVVLF